jgi:hypothetical protein
VRLTGTVTACHPSTDKYGGSYGEIAASDSRTYTWNTGNVFRNFSRLKVDAKVTFEPVGYYYATDIDQSDKERP